MNCAKKQKEIPDFRREDDVWVRTSEEKGTALLDRFLRQTDQGNEMERVSLLHDLQDQYEDELRIPPTPIKADVLKCIIATSSDSAPGSDGIKYTELKDYLPTVCLVVIKIFRRIKSHSPHGSS